MDKDITTVDTATTIPTVSIVMPTHNRATYIGGAIESILAQTYKDWELVIVDDGSTDGTQSIVEPYIARDTRIKCVRQEQNKGIAFSRNNGVARSRGRYIAMLDSDDLWASPDKLATQVAALDADPRIGIIGTWLKIIDEGGRPTGAQLSYPTDDAGIRRSMLYRDALAQSSVLFRKDAFEKAGGYDGRLVVTDDHDLWLKIGLSYRFATLPRYDLLYRRHPGNITRTRRITAAIEDFNIIKRHSTHYPGSMIAYIKGAARYARAIIGFI